ncbi:hypothetical protein ACFX2C_006915 [Malus domestica]
MPYAFTDLAHVTRSHIPAAKMPAKMNVPNDSHLRKRKPTAQGPEEPTVNPTIAYSFYPTHEEILDYGSVLEETNPPPENPYAIATEIMLSDDIESRFVVECRHRTNWSNWKQAIKFELNSLAKRKVFEPVAPTPPHVKPVGYKWVFVRKRNEKSEIVCYKAHLVAQGFS